jgi:hypothetical protein
MLTGALSASTLHASASPMDVGREPAPRDPHQALTQLYHGNKRFVNGEITAPNRNMARLREVAAGGTS